MLDMHEVIGSIPTVSTIGKGHLLGALFLWWDQNGENQRKIEIPLKGEHNVKQTVKARKNNKQSSFVATRQERSPTVCSKPTNGPLPRFFVLSKPQAWYRRSQARYSVASLLTSPREVRRISSAPWGCISSRASVYFPAA